MRNALLIIVLVASTSACAVPRPPVPSDIPFVYDPNMCQSSVMDWIELEPNEAMIYSVGIHKAYNLTVSLEIVSGVDPNDWIIREVENVSDPNGGWNTFYELAWTAPIVAERIYYVELQAKDDVGQADRRTVLIYVRSRTPPFLFPRSWYESVDGDRMKSGQRLVQHAKKIGKPLIGTVRIK